MIFFMLAYFLWLHILCICIKNTYFVCIHILFNKKKKYICTSIFYVQCTQKNISFMCIHVSCVYIFYIHAHVHINADLFIVNLKKKCLASGHWENYLLFSFHIEWDMIVVTVFLFSISHSMWKEMEILFSQCVLCNLVMPRTHSLRNQPSGIRIEK